jgi:hypothetical protein
MEQFRDVNDVETLKAMLVAQQQQLQQLQARQEPASKKRKGSSSRSAEAELLEGSGSEDDIPLDKDDEIWDPTNDSDYDDAPKKKSKSSSSSKKVTAAQKGKKQKQSTIDAAYGESDVSEREQEKTVKAAAAALRSAINGQMVSC